MSRIPLCIAVKPFCAVVGLPRHTWAGFLPAGSGAAVKAQHTNPAWGIAEVEPVAAVLVELWLGSAWPGSVRTNVVASAGPYPQTGSVCLVWNPRESWQHIPSQSESHQFWLQAPVLLCCQDAAGPDSSESRLQGCLASNTVDLGTTEISFL